jgi:hypothetical protein
MNANERADAIIQDILTNHLPRVVEGLKAGYVDENQVLVIYDHAVRARILKEFAEAQPALEEMDNLGKLNRELEAEWKTEMEAVANAKIAPVPPFKTKLINEPRPGIPCGVLKEAEDVDQVMAIIVAINTTNGQRSYVASMDGGYPVHTLDRGTAWVQRIDSARALAVEWTRRYADTTFSVERVADIREPAVPYTGDANYIVVATGTGGHTTYVTHVAGMSRDKILHGSDRKDAFAMGHASALGVCEYLNRACPDAKFKLEAVNAPITPAVPALSTFVLDKAPCASKEPVLTGADLRAMLPEAKRGYAIFQEAEGNAPDIQIKPDGTVAVQGLVFYSVPPATFGAPQKITCVCGGEIKEMPTSIEALLKCSACERVYMDEGEVEHIKRTESMIGQKCNDATYWTTGTLVNGVDPVPIEMQINLNAQKAIVRSVNGKFVLTYEQIVRMALFQDNPHTSMLRTDSDLPMLTCTYRHRVPFEQLPGERDGSLYKGKSVECTPGMVINCMDTSNA